jgi:threonine/homoserine/homoserine lactone efflux protein
MNFTLIFAIFLFAISTTFTPGPNNIMLTASGANFGFKKTLPHILGITFGFPAMVAAIGLGFGVVLEKYPNFHLVLKYAGAVYLVWLSWKIMSTQRVNGENGRGQPFAFWQAAAFQWVNPKAWIMAVSAVSTYSTVQGNLYLEVMVITLLFALVSFPSATVWTYAGVRLGRFLGDRVKLKIFNIVMGFLLLASIIPILRPG